MRISNGFPDRQELTDLLVQAYDLAPHDAELVALWVRWGGPFTHASELKAEIERGVARFARNARHAVGHAEA